MKPEVSVVCVTYNQEKYIEQALDSFVNQVTSFPYEIIVHDDASTDGTRQIIETYAKQYPDKIIPVLQNENQYSKGKAVIREFVYPIVRGKYIAFCEGDDYWCDIHKLQRQYDFMEANPEYSACYHNTIMLNALSGKESLLNAVSNEQDLLMEDVISSTGIKCHVSAMFFRSEYKYRPKEYDLKKIGDFPRLLYLCKVGKVRYLPDAMSLHRVDVEGSWTSKNAASNDAEKQIENYKSINSFLMIYNELTNHEYEETIQKTIEKNECIILQWQDNAIEIIKNHQDYYSSLSAKEKSIIFFKAYFPKTFKWLNGIRHSLKRRKV